MRKRVGAGFVLSAIFPVVAVSVWMLRLAGPASRWVALGIYLAGVGALVLAVARHSPTQDRVRRGRRTVADWFATNRGLLAALVPFALGGWGLAVVVPPGHADIAHEVPADLRARLDRDLGRVDGSASALVRAVESQKALLRDPTGSVDPDRKAALVRAWAAYLDHSIELDRLVEVHQYFYRISPLRHLDLNVRSFLVGYAALVGQLAGAAHLVDAVGDIRDVETVLDEARPETGVPASAYYRLKQRLVAPATALRFHAGRAHLEVLRRAGRLSRPDEAALVQATVGRHAQVSRRVVGSPGIVLDNPVDALEKNAFVAWFPLQRELSEAMGDTRTTARPSLVSASAVAKLGEVLEPGDILIERRNWYLSNIGLPGFWPHAALFVGTPEEQDGYFDEGTRSATAGEPPSRYLERTLPRVAEAFRAEGAAHHPPRVIEAISEGVSLTSLEHSAGADYVAVLRPKVPRSAKLPAVMRAYALLGRPYDFDFDFVTDGAIVCSELVYKAYGSTLRFELVRTADRWVLPPNDIIRKFDTEFETPGAELDFVAFLDGSERERTAFPRDARALRESWRRPKWDVLQK